MGLTHLAAQLEIRVRKHAYRDYLLNVWFLVFKEKITIKNTAITKQYLVMIMMYFSVSDTGELGKKKIRVLLSGVEPKTFRLLVRILSH